MSETEHAKIVASIEEALTKLQQKPKQLTTPGPPGAPTSDPQKQNDARPLPPAASRQLLTVISAPGCFFYRVQGDGVSPRRIGDGAEVRIGTWGS